MAQRGIPLEQRRGLGSYDLNQRLILVKSSASSLVEAIANSWRIHVLEADAYGHLIEFVDNSCIIYRLRNHQWTVLEFLEHRPSLDERAFTCSFSRDLRGEALLFEQSDTCIFIQYDFFNNGCFLESINFQEAAGMDNETVEQRFNTENNCYTLKFRYLSSEQQEDYEGEVPFEVNCCFESHLRQPSVAEIGYPYEFIEDFLEEKSIYIPDIMWFPRGIKEGETQVLFTEGFLPFNFEEFYYMSFG